MTTAGARDITETNAQQAFNRLILEDVLGFAGMLRDLPSYSVLPEVHFQGIVRKTVQPASSRSDVAIGRFHSKAFEVKAVVELKEPDAKLKALQPGDGYRSKITGRQLSPIDQALEAMDRAQVHWALISNMREVCLIHSSDRTAALWLDLTKIAGRQIKLFYFAFGRGGFVSDGSKSSRLDTIRKRIKRWTST